MNVKQTANLTDAQGNVVASVEVTPFPDMPRLVRHSGVIYGEPSIGYGVNYLTYTARGSYGSWLSRLVWRFSRKRRAALRRVHAVREWSR